jgi:hypothetical protein
MPLTPANDHYLFIKIPIVMNRSFTLIFFLMLLVTAGLKAQLTVPTTIQYKNFFIERGSGIACCSCPGVTDKCMAIINSYSKGRGIFMVYHFGPDARPQAGQLNKDYKTHFGDSILTPVWPFYLNMMVNRIDKGVPYGSTFIFGPNNDQVTPECASVVSEVAPVNLAMTSSYNAVKREITVDVKAYYTSTSATPKNFLQVIVAEDSIVGPQCLGSTWDYKYIHMDLFRANINGPLGATISTTTAGTTVSGTYKYIVPAKYGSGTDTTAWITPVIKNLKLIAFMGEDFNGYNTKFGKIQNVISASLGATSIGTGIGNVSEGNVLNIFPNPSNGIVALNTNISTPWSIQVMDILGKEILSHDNILTKYYSLDLSAFPKGSYSIYITSLGGDGTNRMIILK